MKKNLSGNIWKLQLLKTVICFGLFIPILVLFFRDTGMGMQEVFILEAVFSITVIIFEIPTGYFSDQLGRKPTLIFGWIITIIGFAILAVSSSFWTFLLSEVATGIGIGFISGTDSAMLYDTLAELNQKQQYKKIQGRTQSIGLASEAMASIAGGLLALISFRIPLIVEVLILLLGLPITFWLVEPQRQPKKEKESGIKHLARLIKYSLHDHKEIKWIIIYSSLVGSATLTMYWFIQPLLAEFKVSLVYYGTVFAALLLSCSVVSWNAHHIERVLGKKGAFIAMLAAVCLAYFLIGSLMVWWAIGFLLLTYFARGINDPVMLDYLNGLVPLNIRATILSVKFMVGRILFSVIGPIAGWIYDVYGLQPALLISGAIFLLCGMISIFFMHRHKVL